MSPVSVLVVEDEALLALTIEMAFADAGYAVTTALSGSAAVAELESNPDRFDAVLTDIRMPDGVSGWDVGQRARELKPPIPVVYMSGDSAADWAAKGVPNSRMLHKPFPLKQAVKAVSQLLNREGPEIH